MTGATAGGTPERIPFYRNIKILGILAQVVFVVVILFGLALLARNITTALRTSNLPADFSFLGDRAGIPIAETPIRYGTNDPYWKAILIGFLNTLKVALVGVVLASLLGVVIGVMRLSGNWLVRQIATVYVETIRNTPLAVQIVFWFTAVLSPLPPRIENAIELPGGVLFSNKGLAFPWFFPSYRFGAWLPWLLAGLAVFLVLFVVTRRRIVRSDRPGNPWLVPVIAFVVIAAAGYLVTTLGSQLPAGTAWDFNASRGRGTVFIDGNGNGDFDRGESFIPYAAVTVEIAEAELSTSTQNLSESGGLVPGTFRFQPIERREAGEIEVAFADPEDAERFGIELQKFPNVGFIYEDRNGNGSFDAGERLDPESGTGFGGIGLTMRLVDFERSLVADRNGQFRIPTFSRPGSGEEAAQEEGRSPFNVLGPLQPASAEEASLEVEVKVRPAGPLVLSRPTIPVSTYEGGMELTANYLALLLALVVYTASFIAEIVRGGIQAVPKGQREASQALGLSNRQTFSLVVFPQALRIILPPMISQYLNLTKNSSLAPLAGYAELFVITSIVANQTGASIPMALLLIVSYLLISFAFALVLNIVNERLALVER